jgi:hypothetical protein
VSVGAAVFATIALAYVFFRNPEARVEPTEPVRPTLAAEPVVVPLPLPSPEATLQPATTPSAPPPAASVSAARHEARRPALPQKKTAPQGSARPPSSDLIAPY